MSKPAHVLIIGAGLGGPALALALARQRIRSTIFERRPNPQTIGGVLMLAPNAVRVLDKIINIEDEIRKVGRSFDDIEIHLDYGQTTDKIGAFKVTAETFEGYKGILIQRPVIHDKLLELCRRESLISIEFGKNLKSIQEDGKSVQAEFEDGTTARGDILLGVDGIHSRVRNHVLRQAGSEPVTAKYSGHAAVGCVIQDKQKLPGLKSLNEPTFIYTQAGSILAFPTSPSGDQWQWAAFSHAPERERKQWDQYLSSGQAVKDLRTSWKDIKAEPIPSLLGALEHEDPKLWAIYEVPDIPTWHSDRVCLLGDSCHAISPSGGQGTAQALEDVGLMARLLGSDAALAKGYPALFSHFETTRRKRIEFIRKFTERTQSTRFETPSWAVWWGKSIAYRAMFWMMGKVGPVRRNEVLHYDVAAENIVVA